MFNRTARALAVFAWAGVYAASSPVSTPAQSANAGVTVHEWGTFTTVAGPSGHAIDWLPLSGPADLPCFVHHYRNDPRIKLGRETRPLDYEQARSNLWGRVRMETPVLYFYAPRKTSVRVRVEFPRGLMTEWYPEASVSQGIVTRASLRDAAQVSAIEWPQVTIAPGSKRSFRIDVAESHYYAARATDAAPLLVNGQAEKFLFYRGVADFDVAITAEVLPDGAVRIRNTGSEEIPAIILFENRNGALGYRALGALRTEVAAARPSLDGDLMQLRQELERLLVNAGLYPKEAAAMVDTWRDAWFEEGVRVFYILPRRTADAVLPLTIAPAPAQVARVFVGRMDVITPAAQQAVQLAIATGDVDVLDRTGRLLGPITDAVLADSTARTQHEQIRAFRDAAFSRVTRAEPSCR